MRLDECFSEGSLKRTRPSLQKARRSLEVARKYLSKVKANIEIGNHDIAVVVSHTAMFHAARAVLFKEGIKERSHVCMIEYLRAKHKGLGSHVNTLDSYRRLRHTVLYGLDVTIGGDDAKEAVNSARMFISEIQKVIEKI